MVNRQDAGSYTRLSRSHRLERGDGYRRGSVCFDARVSARGIVWDHVPDATLRSLNSGEHSGRVWSRSATNVHSVSSHSTRFFEGTGNTYHALHTDRIVVSRAVGEAGAALHKTRQEAGFVCPVAGPGWDTRLTIHHS